ncbi:MAG TPA: glutamate formimidoyltransferase [Caldisericia bacterium]|nr:glutamate formimidoyltransferase [Caldisericia bacterium]HRU73708.1 glutamate formimidoyltransferase [Caldisericia bacterium]
MKKLVESVPNISEGRNKDVIEEIVNELKKFENIKILEVSSDESHNRTVVTIVGNVDDVVEGLFYFTKKAVELIDLNKHKGEHPRIGAVDVIPLIPISGITKNELNNYVKILGERIWNELNVPVYFYADSATNEERKKLPNIRKGEFEGLVEKMKDPNWHPDIGNPNPHPTAGATVIGVREFLIAYNINLATSDVSIAEKIAKSIRESSGGLMYLQARGFYLEDKNCAQVSMNILNFKKLPLYRVYEIVKMEAEKYGTYIKESELVGLIPLKAVLDSFSFYIKLPELNLDKVIEYKIWGEE